MDAITGGASILRPRSRRTNQQVLGLTLDKWQTALVITTPRFSTTGRSFANDSSLRLSSRRTQQLWSGPCRAHVRADISSSNNPTAV